MSELLSIKTIVLSREDLALGSDQLCDECLLTKEQAAVFLSVSPRTIDAYASNERAARSRRRPKPGAGFPRARERLPYVKIGHAIRFELGELRRFRDERKVAA